MGFMAIAVPVDRFIAWCEQEQASIEQQLELMKSGKVRTGEDTGAGWIDTTAESIERAEARLTELTDLLTEAGSTEAVQTKHTRTPRLGRWRPAPCSRPVSARLSRVPGSGVLMSWEPPKVVVHRKRASEREPNAVWLPHLASLTAAN
jgi:hypothetical protein